MSRASDEVIVDHANCLHKRVADRRADKFESASQQIAAHCVRFGSSSGYGSKLSPTILDRLAVNEVPEIRVERSEFLSHGEKAFRVLDCRCDFQSVPHNAIVVQQPLHIALGIVDRKSTRLNSS